MNKYVAPAGKVKQRSSLERKLKTSETVVRKGARYICHLRCLACPHQASCGKSEAFVQWNAWSSQAARNTWNQSREKTGQYRCKCNADRRTWLCWLTEFYLMWAIIVQLGDWSHQSLSICLSGSLTFKLRCCWVAYKDDNRGCFF